MIVNLCQKIKAEKHTTIILLGAQQEVTTSAAKLIAAQMKHPLLTVDLSEVTSKYIGETEKNLKSLFTRAENANSILFFDEADALFGKRTEIGDAHDRYANIDDKYILQEIKDYHGIVILRVRNRNTRGLKVLYPQIILDFNIKVVPQPVKYTGPGFNAKGSDVAMEELNLEHEELKPDDDD